VKGIYSLQFIIYSLLNTTTKGLRYQQIRENAICESRNIIQIEHISGNINPADMFSKEDKDAKHLHRLRDTIVTPSFQAIHLQSQTTTSLKLENGTQQHHAQIDSSKSNSMTHHQTNIHSPCDLSVDISNTPARTNFDSITYNKQHLQTQIRQTPHIIITSCLRRNEAQANKKNLSSKSPKRASFDLSKNETFHIEPSHKVLTFSDIIRQQILLSRQLNTQALKQRPVEKLVH